jgi:hypothetical protein
MDDLTYAVSKLGDAVDELDQEQYDIRTRLLNACMRGLARLLPNDFPGDLRGAYEQIMEDLTWVPGGGPNEGNIEATLNAMAYEEANAIAEKIRRLYSLAYRVLHGSYPAPEREKLRDPNAKDENPKIVVSPRNDKTERLEKAVGKTIAGIEYGAEASLPEWKHEGEAMVLHFTDGTALSIEIGSNAKNLESRHPGLRPGDIHTDLVPMWRDRPPPK